MVRSSGASEGRALPSILMYECHIPTGGANGAWHVWLCLLQEEATSL